MSARWRPCAAILSNPAAPLRIWPRPPLPTPPAAPSVIFLPFPARSPTMSGNPELPLGPVSVEGSIYEGCEAALSTDLLGTVAHVVRYRDALAIAEALNATPALPEERARLVEK